MTKVATTIFDHANPKKFWSIFNLEEFASTCKKSRYFTNLFWGYGWLNLCRNTADTINLRYRTNLVKINHQICQWIHKTALGPYLVHFPNFGGNFFFQKIWLSRTTAYLVLTPCQNLEKTDDTIPGKCPDRWKYGGKERSYFIAPFPLPRGVQKLFSTDFDHKFYAEHFFQMNFGATFSFAQNTNFVFTVIFEIEIWQRFGNLSATLSNTQNLLQPNY